MKYPKLSMLVAFCLISLFVVLAGCAARAGSLALVKSPLAAVGADGGVDGGVDAGTAPRPYTTEYPASLSADPWHPYQEMYFSRPRTVTKAVTLHNRGLVDAIATVSCPGVTRNLFVKAGGERRFLQDMSSIHLHENACVVDFFHYVGTPGPEADSL